MQACKRHLPFAYFNRPHAPPSGRHSDWGVSWVYSPTEAGPLGKNMSLYTVGGRAVLMGFVKVGIGIRLVTVTPSF